MADPVEEKYVIWNAKCKIYHNKDKWKEDVIEIFDSFETYTQNKELKKTQYEDSCCLLSYYCQFSINSKKNHQELYHIN